MNLHPAAPKKRLCTLTVRWLNEPAPSRPKDEAVPSNSKVVKGKSTQILCRALDKD